MFQDQIQALNVSTSNLKISIKFWKTKNLEFGQKKSENFSKKYFLKKTEKKI